jgi:hypothetical protein
MKTLEVSVNGIRYWRKTPRNYSYAVIHVREQDGRKDSWASWHQSIGAASKARRESERRVRQTRMVPVGGFLEDFSFPNVGSDVRKGS